MAIEIHERYSWIVHENIADSVDQILQGLNPITQMRNFYSSGKTVIKKFHNSNYSQEYYNEFKNDNNLINENSFRHEAITNTYFNTLKDYKKKNTLALNKRVCSIYTFGLSYQYMEKLVNKFKIPIELTRSLTQADTILGLRSQIKNNKKILYIAKNQNKNIFTVGNNSLSEILKILNFILKYYGYNEIKYDIYPESEND